MTAQNDNLDERATKVADQKNQMDEAYIFHTITHPQSDRQDEINSATPRAIRAQKVGFLADRRLLEDGKLPCASLQADMALQAKGLADLIALKVAVALEAEPGLSDQILKGAQVVGELTKVASVAIGHYEYLKDKEEGRATKPLITDSYIPKSIRGRITQERRTEQWQADLEKVDAKEEQAIVVENPK